MVKQRLYSYEAMQSLGKLTKDSLQRAMQCCPNCNNFDAMREVCKLNNLKPPATIIAFSCEKFNWNDCPF